MTAIDTSLTPHAAARTTGALRVVVWGSYDTSKPRTRILVDGLHRTGAEVTEIHADVWSQDADKSQLGRSTLLWRLIQMVLAYPVLIWRYLRAPAHDVVLVPYLGQFDAIVLRPFAALRGVPVVLDLFISLYDTVVQDRGKLSARHPLARLLRWIEKLACRSATSVLLDTQAHARRIAGLMAAPTAKFDAVPVGAETTAFAQLPARTDHAGPTRILFYGQLIPLHGLQVILQAAQSPRGQAHHWHIVGTGQDQALLHDTITDAPHITWTPWLPYADLRQAIADSDICLGIFGTSDKAASVVPNKVYQALAAGRSVITRSSPAMAETFSSNPALALVAPGEPDALLDGIDALINADFPAMPPQALDHVQPAAIATLLHAKLQHAAEKGR